MQNAINKYDVDEFSLHFFSIGNSQVNTYLEIVHGISTQMEKAEYIH